MRQSKRTPVLLLLLSTLVSLLVLAPAGTANAAESIPPLQWPAATIGRLDGSPVTSTNGDITLPCATVDAGSDLTTYSASGQIVRQISRTSFIDGVTNCIGAPIADKNGDIYGIPFGKNANNNWATGPNLLAYTGSTLKWKYPLSCGYDTSPSYAVGANGNIYSTARLSDGVHLIGLTPDVAAGQTVPTKILDVKISNDCTIMLRTYKDGIMLHGQLSGNAQYYSYSGKSLGQAAIGDVWYEKMNADGQLFVLSYVWGSGFRSASINRYDPSTGTVKWTTSVSTPGADTNGATLLPTANGGLVALVIEQKMISDGVPATPKTWVKALVTVNASGQKIRSVILPDTYASGTYGNTYLTAESGGKVVVIRELYVNTGLSYPSTVSGVSVLTYDPVDNTWPYGQAILGDINKPGGPYGYALDYQDFTKASHSVNGTVYVLARCSGNCGTIGRKLFALTVSGLGVDYPQGVIVNTSPRPAATYVALGDSFSSGEGVPIFETDTEIPGVNTCHRSTVAYPQLIAGSSVDIPPLSAGSFRACSGAVTLNVTDLAQWNEGIQLDWYPDPTTQLVTLTIGGNDIGFADYAMACVILTSSCDFGTTAYNTTVNKVNNELPAKLEATYKRILQYAPNARIYVIGYPQVIANKLVTDPDDSRCFYMQGGSSKWGEARAARDIVAKLNEKIVQKVDAVRGMSSGNLRLHYVPLDGIESPFNGHEVCGTASTSWFQNVDQAANDFAYVFHPNDLGQEEYATVVAAAINAS